MKSEIVDGCVAACHIAYACSEVAFIYPITPSSSISEAADSWMVKGKKNLFDQVVSVVEMQSEMGSAGALHGSLCVGCVTTTFTASQGLLLMIPNMYKIAGELWPCVFHVTARALATSSLSIFGDHNDIMAARQTGWAFLGAMTVQEVMDLALVAHISTLESSMPFVHFFDGFRTSHELQKIEMIDYDTIKALYPYDKLRAFRSRALNPTHPVLRGTATSSDVYFQTVESRNAYYDAVPTIVQDVMNKVAKYTGRQYNLFDYYGYKEAEYVIVVMGSGGLTIEEMIEYLIKESNEKVGMIKVRLFRPWSPDTFAKVLPTTVRRITVLERCKESGALGEPLYLDVSTTIMRIMQSDSRYKNISVIGGRYGLASKEFTPGMALSIWENMRSESPIQNFSVGINDDVTFKSLQIRQPKLDLLTDETRQCMFWGLGSDGTVSANKNAIKIIGESTNLFVQGYFAYDAKKAGGATMSHLRFGPKPIKSPYLLQRCDYIAVHHPSYIYKFDVLENIKENGIFVLNCSWKSVDKISEELPARIKSIIARNNIRMYVVDAQDVAIRANLGRRINNILMVAFFRLANIIPFEEAINLIKDAIQKSYSKKGEAVIKSNWRAVDLALESLIEVKYNRDAWLSSFSNQIVGNGYEISKGIIEEYPYSKTTSETSTCESPFSKKQIQISINEKPDLNKFVSDVLEPVNALKGDNLPVSVFDPSGVVPLGTTAFEKRGIAISIPIVDMNKCTQCNYCSIVCPHAAIRPFLLEEVEFEEAPKSMHILRAKGGAEFSSYYYRIQVAPLDCTGCELCVHACPDDALHMEPLQMVRNQEIPHWNYLVKLPNHGYKFDKSTVKGSQFQKPLLEFSAACEGCGETPYIKLLTQLFGERMVIANATGCSSIWGASFPSVPYTVTDKGYGPAWGNSLFEDNAEYGLGMVVGYRQRRTRIEALIKEFLNKSDDQKLKNIHEKSAIKDVYLKFEDYLRSWLKNMNEGDVCQYLYEKITTTIEENLECNKFDTLLSDEHLEMLRRIYQDRDLFPKISHWIVGGDGWAYDIGYAGLDHVLAYGEDVNILILDTEVYSNTGGQTSKSTPFGAVAKFSQGGNLRQKKDLGLIAMEYGSVYVASIALGANYQQTIRSLMEAERYPGTSLIIAYSTCIEHGYDKYTLQQESVKLAVESGYWPLYRFNPQLLKFDEINNTIVTLSTGFTLDSKKIKADISQFLKRENRFLQLFRSNPELASITQSRLKIYSDRRFQHMKNLSENLSVTSLKDQVKKLKDKLLALQNGEAGGGDLNLQFERNMHILYGTETGNSEDVALYIQAELTSRGYTSTVCNLDDIDIDEFLDPSQYSSFILVTSTAGQGEFPGSSKILYESLERRYIELLSNGEDVKFLCNFMQYGVFGLGDSTYVYFNEAAKKWDKLLSDCGAVRIGRMGLGDDQSDEKYETDLIEWLPDYLQLVNAPEPSNTDDQPKDPLYNVQVIENIYRNDQLNIQTGTLHAINYEGNCDIPYTPILPPNSILLPLIENTRITSLDHDRDVRHLIFDLSDDSLHKNNLRYNLGDSLALYAQNDFEEAKKACEFFGFNPYSIIEINLNQIETNKNIRVNQRYLSIFGMKMTILQLFVECLDLWGKPGRRFYHEFYRYCSGSEKEHAKKWSRNEGKSLIQEFQSETKTFIDMFYLYPSAKPSLSQLLDIVPLIKPRYYSIASSCKYVNNSKIELCVGIVDWNTSSGILKYGQCTGFINRLPKLISKESNEGIMSDTSNFDIVPVLPCSLKSSAFNLPKDNMSPIIMACMGTGLAPFRAFIQYKYYVKTVLKQEIGPVILYFGCRYKNKDYLYREELEQYVNDGIITSLNVAFSRDPIEDKKQKLCKDSRIRYRQKVYVQRIMEENSSELHENLIDKEGYFYLCGTKQVPIDIRKAIVNIIMSQDSNATEESANEILNGLQIKGRYNIEAWS
ncbi:pyruvate:NADP+ oxidoreductase protein, putative [Cryptosporidium muris RN66]|uniref:pyruvate dehydrogenase (NADP(+)) n=1 Tax=Cryptosporidium muris (strain RN66) TaxID=441375 RepID=B6AEJ2_CRYMR|nr:pyruvate:NADP+ oxidoreductase protein, putative [Cryptosporidium muris RN66]EEA06609.1 pyruvate:NADP+ oxidoreductase protein, putative [Cryptosporidium muris RN66]|eukprot:XP_002140958.1 pyruvate:NADP+ oxidoreductase protein [Cryptosporidium muris RN66]